MTDSDMEALGLTKRRAEAVAIVSSLTARALKISQAIAGMEMETLRIELEIGRNPDDRQLPGELREAEENAEAMRETLAECGREIEAAEENVAAIDRLMTAAKGE